MSQSDTEPRLDPDGVRETCLQLIEDVEADDLDTAESRLVELIGQVRMVRGER